MPTNLAIDDKLIEEARLIGLHRTKKAVVNNQFYPVQLMLITA